MKELYQSPELDILCLRAVERLTTGDQKVDATNLNNGNVSITYGDIGGDDWIDIPL